MISIYFEERVLHLTDDINGTLGENFDTIHQFSTPGDLCQFLHKFTEDISLQTGYLYGEDIEAIFKHTKSYYKFIEAAGGIIHNRTGDFLFIYRLGKWDLPKGKLDKGEKPKDAAVREVHEEVDLEGVQIKRKLPSTFHTYPLKGKTVLKETHWYEMQYLGDSLGKPQTTENIERLEWRSKENIQDILCNTYPSILPIIEHVK